MGKIIEKYEKISWIVRTFGKYYCISSCELFKVGGPGVPQIVKELKLNARRDGTGITELLEWPVPHSNVVLPCNEFIKPVVCHAWDNGSCETSYGGVFSRHAPMYWRRYMYTISQ